MLQKEVITPVSRYIQQVIIKMLHAIFSQTLHGPQMQFPWQLAANARMSPPLPPLMLARAQAPDSLLVTCCLSCCSM
jgi:hypothetical protein